MKNNRKKVITMYQKLEISIKRILSWLIVLIQIFWVFLERIIFIRLFFFGIKKWIGFIKFFTGAISTPTRLIIFHIHIIDRMGGIICCRSWWFTEQIFKIFIILLKLCCLASVLFLIRNNQGEQYWKLLKVLPWTLYWNNDTNFERTKNICFISLKQIIFWQNYKYLSF